MELRNRIYRLQMQKNTIFLKFVVNGLKIFIAGVKSQN